MSVLHFNVQIFKVVDFEWPLMFDYEYMKSCMRCLSPCFFFVFARRLSLAAVVHVRTAKTSKSSLNLLIYFYYDRIFTIYYRTFKLNYLLFKIPLAPRPLPANIKPSLHTINNVYVMHIAQLSNRTFSFQH